MQRSITKELLYLLLCLIPFLYLALIYSQLSDPVPTHFGLNGEINGWSSKSSLWFIPAGLGLMMYILFLLMPLIDPKQKLKSGGGKFEHIKFIVLIFINAISCFCLYVSLKQSFGNMNNFFFAILGLFFAALGNFFPSLKPNYFIGIRTPWALENEMVWKKTHQVSGKIWMTCGLILAVLPFLIPDHKILNGLFLAITLIMAFSSSVISFLIWKRLKKEKVI